MNVRNRSGDVGPAAREAMGKSCISCMWSLSGREFIGNNQ